VCCCIPALAEVGLLQRELHLPGLRRLVDQLVRGGQISRQYELDPPSVAPRLERRLRLRSSAPFGDVAAYISRFLTLQPGDMFLSGTPAGTAIESGIDGPFMQPGDVIEVEIEGAGILRNRRAG